MFKAFLVTLSYNMHHHPGEGERERERKRERDRERVRQKHRDDKENKPAMKNTVIVQANTLLKYHERTSKVYSTVHTGPFK